MMYFNESGLDRAALEVRRWLNRPISTLMSVVGWISATTVFVGLSAVIGGPAQGDAAVSVYSTWAVAHGHLACAYSAIHNFHFPAVANPYTLIAPLYPLLSGAILAVVGIPGAKAFPTSAQLGPQCSKAFGAIYHWSIQTDTIDTTIRVGYVCWLVLLAGTVAVLRASGRGRRGWEPFTLVILALLPPVLECVVIFFHPQDLLAMGLVLGCLALVLRGRWGWAGVMLGLAFTSNQFVILAAAPLIILAPGRERIRMSLGSLGAFALVVAPMMVITSGRVWRSAIIGSGFNPARGGALIWELHWKGAPQFGVSRVVPIACSLGLAWWARRRLGDRALEPAPLFAILALSFTFRLMFEVSFWGYYLTAVAVMLVVLDVVSGRIRGQVVAWLALVTLVFNPVPYAFLSNGTSWGLRAQQLMPDYFLVGAVLVILVDVLRHKVKWYLVSWVVLVGLTLVRRPWTHELARRQLPVWFWQVVLVSTVLWLVVEPFWKLVRSSPDLDAASVVEVTPTS